MTFFFGWELVFAICRKSRSTGITTLLFFTLTTDLIEIQVKQHADIKDVYKRYSSTTTFCSKLYGWLLWQWISNNDGTTWCIIPWLPEILSQQAFVRCQGQLKADQPATNIYGNARKTKAWWCHGLTTFPKYKISSTFNADLMSTKTLMADRVLCASPILKHYPDYRFNRNSGETTCRYKRRL